MKRGTYITLPKVRIRPLPKGLRLGDRIEARPRNEDELFYPGIIVGRDYQHGCTKSEATFTVMYDDGDVESELKASSIIRFGRCIVWQGNSVIVEDGTILVNGVFRRVRLLHFKSSPGIYQSGLLMSSWSIHVPDFTLLPFEVNQAMLLGVGLYSYANNGRMPLKTCFAGLGGGAVPACLAGYISPGCTVHAIEISEEVSSASKKYFCLPGNVRIINCDAYEWLTTNESEYDLVIIDVTDAGDQFLPPEPFLDVSIIQRALKKPGSVCVMNVLSSLSTPAHVRKATRIFSECSKSSYCAHVDPNHVFFGISNEKEDLCQLDPNGLRKVIESIPLLANAVPGMLRELETRPDQIWKQVLQMNV